MNHAKKIELISELLSEFSSIQNNADTVYHNKVEIYVRKIFGDNSHYLEKINKILYSPIFRTNLTTNDEFIKAWKQGMSELKSFLITMKSELEFDKNFENEKNKLNCLLLFPYNKERMLIQNFIEKNLTNSKICIQKDDSKRIRNTFIHTGLTLQETLLSSLKSMDLIIADITENNPNILYEIGFAHALKKPTILISQNKLSHVSILLGFQVIIYQKDALETLLKYLKYNILRLISLDSKFGLKETDMRWG